MNSPLRVVLWACVSFGAVPVAHAQEATVPLAQVYQSALAHNPALLAEGLRIEALKAGRENANSLIAAPLTLEGSYRSDRNFDNQGLRETSLGLSAPLWLWNERSTNQNLRQLELAAGEQRAAQLKLELAGQVRQVYWNALAAQLDVDMAQARLGAASSLMADVKRRVDAGDLARVDLLQATALQAQASAELGRALSTFSSVGSEFAEVTGLSVTVLNANTNTNANASANTNANSKPVAERLPNDTNLNVQAHPLVQSAQHAALLQGSRADLVAIQRRENPEVGLALINERAGFVAPNEKSLVLSTRIPLGSRAEHASRLLAARADETEAQETLKRVGTRIKAQATAAQANVEWFEKLQGNAQEQAELARQVYTLHQKSFALGETDFPTLLRFEQQAFEAERLAKKSTIEFSTKVSAWLQALGLLPGQAP